MDSTDPLRVRVDDRRNASTAGYRLHLAQSITRKKKFEQAIKYGTELGITDFTPLLSEHTVRDPNNPEKQLRRWKKIAMDSARITDRDWLPTINEITRLEDLFPAGEGTIFLGDETGYRPDEAFASGQNSALLMVGPEGGFTEPERTLIKNSGGESVSLGSVNYRAETASLILSNLWLTEAAPDRDRGERRTRNP